MENAILLNKISSSVWTTDPDKLDVSELFIMMNMYNTAYNNTNYCGGADFVPAVN